MTLKQLACGLALLCLPFAAEAQSLAPQTTWVNDRAQFVIRSVDAGKAFPVTGWIDGDMISFTAHRKEPVNCTTIQAWTGFVRDGLLLVEYLAVATEGGRAGLINGSDRYRRQ